jgi:hypothetical protein
MKPQDNNQYKLRKEKKPSLFSTIFSILFPPDEEFKPSSKDSKCNCCPCDKDSSLGDIEDKTQKPSS